MTLPFEPARCVLAVGGELKSTIACNGKETVATGIMVLIMTLILSFFFFGIDAAFSTIVRFLLARAGS